MKPDFMNRLENIIHGTTLLSNAIIERRGAKTGLITTRGHRDILEIRRENRYDLYDLNADFYQPLVPRYLRKEVNERIYSDGRVLIPLNHDDLKPVLSELFDESIQSLAVCLLHAYRNPEHEKIIKDIVAEIAPQLPISLSSEVLPEIKEYERTSTTVVNAYIMPLIQSYLTQLLEKLSGKGFRKKLFLMLSTGGLASVETVSKFPVRLIESGPAAGALVASWFGQMVGVSDLISLDMGGTTAKACLIRNGKPTKTTEFEIARVQRFKKRSGIPVGISALDLIEIGAGGGSIAEINSVGLVQVGPRSAGASPGPICYGKGGKEPTVSDADLILGYLNPDYFLGGEMRLDSPLARKGLEDHIAKRSGVSLTEAAWRIHNVVNDNMALAIKIHVIEKGGDPAKLSLLAFGGAGPVHAYEVAKKLKIKKVLIPFAAGAASALGFLIAPAAFDLVQTYKVTLNQADLDEAEAIYKQMEKEVTSILEEAGISRSSITYYRSAGMDYVGQGYALDIPIPNMSLRKMKKGEIQSLFNKNYMQLYGRLSSDVEAEFVDLRVVGESQSSQFDIKRTFTKNRSLAKAIKGKREAYFSIQSAYLPCTVYDRYLLFPGASFEGPAIIEERESTTVVGPDTSVFLDPYGIIHVSIGGKQKCQKP
jgi:N-methylhydantoinase A